MKLTPMMNRVSNLARDIALFLKAPREFLYSFTYPNNKYVTIKQYHPAAKNIGNKLINSIYKKFPELKIFFFGSAMLGIAGEKDIDIMIESSSNQFNKYMDFLISLLGEPVKRKHTLIEWQFKKDECDVQVLLVDHSHPIVKQSLKTFNTLKNNKSILQAYEQVKIAANGLPVREYARRKLKFFTDHGL